MIHARALTRTYGARTAIQGVDFTVGRGEVVGLLGPNGAGKSTTMRILAGALAASSGSVQIDGHDVFADPIAVKRVVGFLPERPPLYADMGVADFLSYAATLHGVSDVAGAVSRALDLAAVREVATRPIGRLSKGFKQRVGLAAALVHSPKVLLLDEPASGLDPVQRVEMRALVRRLAAGDVTVLLSTHVLAEVEFACDRVIALHHGRVVLDSRLDAIGGGGVVRVRVGRVDGAGAALAGVPGVASVDSPVVGTFLVRGEGDLRAAVARAAAPFDLLELGSPSGLEDLFVRLAREDA
jgi:ABC-2 type transport system ATP-binding protein